MSEELKKMLSRLGLLLAVASMLATALWMCSCPACGTPLLHLLAAWWAFMECPLIVMAILEGSGKEKP